ncbi:hypothetical protein ACIP5Y_07560 [Nocardia sp. NPDC088792]|uniref:hypothetical protein n=1 Tax=Nocardia sp. NPDC088792 TaxID=3364332 RepID=UPI003815E1E7
MRTSKSRGKIAHRRSFYTGESFRWLMDHARLRGDARLPAATGDQAWLESEIFRRITNSGWWLAHPLGIASVQIERDNSLTIHLDGCFRAVDTAYPFSLHVVHELLPHLGVDGEFWGVPGLRVNTVNGRDLVVSLVDSPAKVTLCSVPAAELQGIPRNRWKHQIADLETMLNHDGLPHFWNSPTRTAAERDFAVQAPLTSACRRELAWLGSALLRRAALLHTASTAYNTKNLLKGDTWHIEFFTRHGVPVDHDRLLKRLCDPALGLPIRVIDSSCACNLSKEHGTLCTFNLAGEGTERPALRLAFSHHRYGDEELRMKLADVGASENWLDRVLPKQPAPQPEAA